MPLKKILGQEQCDVSYLGKKKSYITRPRPRRSFENLEPDNNTGSDLNSEPHVTNLMQGL
jgi:hypothetical protein